MSQIQRLRPGQPNPLRYQGNLRHYHVAPLKRRVRRSDMADSRRSARNRRVWQTAMIATLAVAIFATVAGALLVGGAG